MAHIKWRDKDSLVLGTVEIRNRTTGNELKINSCQPSILSVEHWTERARFSSQLQSLMSIIILSLVGRFIPLQRTKVEMMGGLDGNEKTFSHFNIEAVRPDQPLETR